MDDSKLAKHSFIVSIAGIFIALCALGLSIYQGYLQKENYEISIQPYITIVPTIDRQKSEYGYYIYNAGHGKGYIEKVEYFINGKKLTGTNLSSLKQVVHQFGLNDNCFVYGNPRQGDSVSLDEMNKLLTISSGAYLLSQCTNTIKDFQKYLMEKPAQLTMKIWYKSLYDIYFLYDSSDNSQLKL